MTPSSTDPQTILFLAANPGDTSRLQADQELRDIRAGLERAQKRDLFKLEQRLAVRPLDIQRAILDINPQIVHFSGHSLAEQGLIFEDEIGNTKLVSGEALASLFELFADRIKCVVLNGCYSEIQAKAIVQHISFVIGMNQDIRYNIAKLFAVSFYDALGAGRDFEFAYRLGCTAIHVEGFSDYLAPILLKRANNEDTNIELKPLSSFEYPSSSFRENKPSSNTQDVDLLLPSNSNELELARPGVSKQPFPESAVEFNVIRIDSIGQQVDLDRRINQVFVEELDDELVVEMMLIPSGIFLMGASESEEARNEDELPRRYVNINSFLIGKFPVTQSQWEFVSRLPRIERELEHNPSHFKEAKRPVETVSWKDAMEFCARLTAVTGNIYRLPSEAEWEYACRALTETPFHFGETITSELANFNGGKIYAYEGEGTFRQQTTPIDYFKFPNSFGLYDMHGNVWEWCADPWHNNYAKAPIDGTVWTTNGERNFRVMRGGSWNSSPNFCRSGYRMRGGLEQRGDGIGFRVARSITNREESKFTFLPK